MGLLALSLRDYSQSNKSQCEKIFPDFSYLTTTHILKNSLLHNLPREKGPCSIEDSYKKLSKDRATICDIHI